MTVFEPDYRPIPIFSGLWVVVVLVSVVITATRNDRQFIDLLVGDFWEILLYVAMGVVASCGAVLWGWRRVQVTDDALIVERLSSRFTGKRQVVKLASIREVGSKYSALARSHVTVLTLDDARTVRIPHNNLRRGSELISLLRSLEDYG